jgi:hypothetical protein
MFGLSESLKLRSRGQLVRLGAACGVQKSFKFDIELSRDLRYAFISELSEQGRWQVILKDSVP